MTQTSERKSSLLTQFGGLNKMDAINNFSINSNYIGRQFVFPAPAEVVGEAATSAPEEVAAVATEALAGADALAEQWNFFLAGTVAVIDDFVPEVDGFNHGQQIADLIESNAALSGIGVNTLRLNVDNGTTDRVSAINGALDEVIGKVLDGEDITAVNLSQQSTNFDLGTLNTNFRLATLESLGVPTVVAAGNNGARSVNTLAFGSSLVVENSATGSEERASTSGLGTVRSEGAFTSQAATNVTFRAAALRASGLSVPAIAQNVAGQAAAQGGSLNTPAPFMGPVAPPARGIAPIGPALPPTPAPSRKEVREARLSERREARAERVETRVAAREARQDARATVRTERQDARATAAGERQEAQAAAQAEREQAQAAAQAQREQAQAAAQAEREQAQAQRQQAQAAAQAQREQAEAAAQAQRDQAAAAAAARDTVRQEARDVVQTQRQELRAAVQAERETAKTLRQEARAERLEAKADRREARQAARAEAPAPAAPAATAFTGTSFSARQFFGPSITGPVAPPMGPFATRVA